MKKQISITSSLIALAALSFNALTAFAYPAEMPDVTPAASPERMCSHTQFHGDIPARWADYMIENREVPCTVVASASISRIPVTGSAMHSPAQAGAPAAYKDLKFKNFKERRNLFYMR